MIKGKLTTIFLTLFLLVIIVFSAGCNFHYHEHCEACQQAAYESGVDWMGWLNTIAQWAMAIGAILVFWLTRKTLIHAEETADTSMKLTRESIKVQIEGSRAVLGLADFRLNPHTGVFVFAIKNLGQNPATIIGLEIRPNTSVQLLLIQTPFIQVEMFHPLMAGEAYIWDEQRRDTVLHPITGIPDRLWIDQEGRETWKSGLFSVTLFYRTMGGEYINQTAIEIYPNMSAKVMADPRITYDGIIPDDVAMRIERDRQSRFRPHR
ncbi:MAG: hypothetical protein JST10_10130 [Bacteroidetes bacterium]|nr:hypothetical protein [Bacteroidota bacterium]